MVLSTWYKPNKQKNKCIQKVLCSGKIETELDGSAVYSSLNTRNEYSVAETFSFFSSAITKEASGLGWGVEVNFFQIQQPEIGKVRKICWNHLQFMAAYISVAAARKMSLSVYTVLDNKLAPCTSVIASKCPRVCAINYPLPMFITNSGLCTIIWLYKCSTLLCVISTIQIIPFHIFTKWPKWYVVTYYCVVFLEI